MSLRVFTIGLLTTLALPVSTAMADGSQAGRGVITTPDVVITSRAARPQAAVAISRIAPKLTLLELKQLFVQRIEESLTRGGF